MSNASGIFTDHVHVVNGVVSVDYAKPLWTAESHAFCDNTVQPPKVTRTGVVSVRYVLRTAVQNIKNSQVLEEGQRQGFRLPDNVEAEAILDLLREKKQQGINIVALCGNAFHVPGEGLSIRSISLYNGNRYRHVRKLNYRWNKGSVFIYIIDDLRAAAEEG